MEGLPEAEVQLWEAVLQTVFEKQGGCSLKKAPIC